MFFKIILIFAPRTIGNACFRFSVVAVFMMLPVADASAQMLFRAAPGVSAQLARVRFQVMSGRICAINDTPGGKLSFGAKSLGREENLTIDLAGAFPDIDYSIVTRKTRLTITVANGGRFSAVCAPQGSQPGEEISFHQIPAGPLVLEVGDQEHRHEYRAESLWGLMIAAPDVTKTHLLPVLQVLRAKWPLHEQALEVERHLCSLADHGTSPDRERLVSLVAELGADRFDRRRKAERDLRELGYAALPFFQDLPRDKLDAEQRSRIRRLVAELGGPGQEDVPIVVARRMVSDWKVWLALLDRPDLETRRIAQRQLQRIMDQEMDFDPDGTVEERARQRETLQVHFSDRIQSELQEIESSEPKP